MLARFSVLSRLKPHENSNLYSKMRAYDGESLKDTDPRTKSVQEYRDAAGVDEGMDGISTRFAFKVLSSTFNFDTLEVAADPVHLMYVLEQAIWREQFPEDTEKKFLNFIKSELAPRYASSSATRSRRPYLESYADYGQNLFDRYVAYADAWIEDQDYKDADTGQLMNRELLNQELSDRKAGRDRQPQGLPQRGRQICAQARANIGATVWTLREAARGHRAAHVQPSRGSPAGDQLRLEEGQRYREEAHRLPAAHGVARLHGASGPSPGRVVHARQQGRMTQKPLGSPRSRVHEHRRPRPNPKGKSLSNRQRFISRAKAELKRAVQDALKKRKVAEIGNGEKVAIPTKGISEPSFRHSRRTGKSEYIVPGNKEYVVGDEIPRPDGGGGKGSEGSPDGSGEDSFEFTLSREEFLDMFFEDLELPDLVKKTLKETTATDLSRAGFTVAGAPAISASPHHA